MGEACSCCFSIKTFLLDRGERFIKTAKCLRNSQEVPRVFWEIIQTVNNSCVRAPSVELPTCHVEKGSDNALMLKWLYQLFETSGPYKELQLMLLQLTPINSQVLLSRLSQNFSLFIYLCIIWYGWVFCSCLPKKNCTMGGLVLMKQREWSHWH